MVHINPKAPSPNFETRRCVVYAVDVATGRVLAASMAPDEVLSVQRAVLSERDRAESVPPLAIRTIRRLAQTQADPAHPEVKIALIAACAALSTTMLFQRVLEAKGAPTGHFLFMVYMFADGHLLARCTYGDTEQKAVLDPASIHLLVAQTIQHDHALAGGIVSGEVRERGGFVMCPPIQALVEGGRIELPSQVI